MPFHHCSGLAVYYCAPIWWTLHNFHFIIDVFHLSVVFAGAEHGEEACRLEKDQIFFLVQLETPWTTAAEASAQPDRGNMECGIRVIDIHSIFTRSTLAFLLHIDSDPQLEITAQNGRMTNVYSSCSHPRRVTLLLTLEVTDPTQESVPLRNKMHPRCVSQTSPEITSWSEGIQWPGCGNPLGVWRKCENIFNVILFTFIPRWSGRV